MEKTPAAEPRIPLPAPAELKRTMSGRRGCSWRRGGCRSASTCTVTRFAVMHNASVFVSGSHALTPLSAGIGRGSRLHQRLDAGVILEQIQDRQKNLRFPVLPCDNSPDVRPALPHPALALFRLEDLHRLSALGQDTNGCNDTPLALGSHQPSDTTQKW